MDKDSYKIIEVKAFSSNSVKTARNIAYLRVSTLDQDLEKYKSDILHLANEKDLGRVEFVQEKVLGKVSWRQRKIAPLLEDLGAGDSILLSEFSRLGLSMLECMEIISIALQRGIRVYTVKGNWQLDDSIQSKVKAMVFSMASEIERDLISKRTRESLASKKHAGVKLARPKGPGKSKPDAYSPEIEALLRNGSTQKFIASCYMVTEATFCNWLKRNSIKRSEESYQFRSINSQIIIKVTSPPRTSGWSCSSTPSPSTAASRSTKRRSRGRAKSARSWSERSAN